MEGKISDGKISKKRPNCLLFKSGSAISWFSSAFSSVTFPDEAILGNDGFLRGSPFGPASMTSWFRPLTNDISLPIWWLHLFLRNSTAPHDVITPPLVAGSDQLIEKILLVMWPRHVWLLLFYYFCQSSTLVIHLRIIQWFLHRVTVNIKM